MFRTLAEDAAFWRGRVTTASSRQLQPVPVGVARVAMAERAHEPPLGTFRLIPLWEHG